MLGTGDMWRIYELRKSWIMHFLSFPAILFEKAIILGAENDSLSYATGAPTSPDPFGAPNALFPFCILQRTVSIYARYFNTIWDRLTHSNCTSFLMIAEPSLFASDLEAIDTTEFGLLCLGNCTKLFQTSVFSAFSWITPTWGNSFEF